MPRKLTFPKVWQFSEENRFHSLSKSFLLLRIMQPSTTNRNVFIIAGMHRSGTSLTAALLQNVGVDIGQRLMGASYSNSKGHFENLDFVEFHEDILHSHGLSKAGWTLEESVSVQPQYWDRAKALLVQNSSKPIWGWKDPRTTLFLQFWLDLIPHAKFLLIYRSPWEVVDSLYRRDDDLFYSNPNFALQLWIHYNQISLNFCRQEPDKSILLNIKNIAREPTYLTDRVEERLGIPLPSPNNDIYDNSLLHIQPPTSQRMSLLEHYFHEALDLYRDLEIASGETDETSEEPGFPMKTNNDYAAWALQDWLDVRRLERELSFSKERYQQTKAEMEKFHIQFMQSQAKLEASQNLITAMESSKFWQLREKWLQLKRVLGLKGNE